MFVMACQTKASERTKRCTYAHTLPHIHINEHQLHLLSFFRSLSSAELGPRFFFLLAPSVVLCVCGGRCGCVCAHLALALLLRTSGCIAGLRAGVVVGAVMGQVCVVHNADDDSDDVDGGVAGVRRICTNELRGGG